ncbi:ligase-associated DNA damage response DEXH box helicase [Fulvimarina sp. 2208YS6-2-32]|uniref:Ligase-associated DNA damage response DEXH box helicase n=1 Tax=Fulvimarina uroteuthidis TaxID=3098149 RepID=A0ABU5I593_9HYPH|nr:ligase-associated DNA damage response DEXH box helicase [Fulvimarina sp. 2208YS6-2-32]MDY8110275.1 ligase-associated DNA damage response DEXH box helicase [Fulvimarina sp. 2208YS6-2-32]
MNADAATASFVLPKAFTDWFDRNGWAPRPHQLDLIARAQDGRSVLLIAPTGAGKTLAGFLPALVDLAGLTPRRPGTRARGVHTLYISPLKALATDIRRNLERPVEEMGLRVTLETRTGDTSQAKRQRQKLKPPDILLTTPEQLALLIAGKDARDFFADLKYVVFDELHALVTSKRGHLLALGLARLRKLAPGLQTVGLSATVSQPAELCRWLVPQVQGADAQADLIEVSGGAKPDIAILESEARVPWQGHTCLYAMGEIYEAVKAHRTVLLFVNTRFQAELLFQELWKINEDTLPIALHHGSLDVAQRRRVEAAMARNALRAVVATSTLDLGIDWGDVDLVVHVGAPKGASRLAQRIGRANHRMDEPSKAILVPSNRFEVMECQAALNANYLGDQDTPPLREGALDVLAQHVLGMAVAEPFHADALYDEIVTAAPYASLAWETFEQIVDFVATGGYALRVYERYARIRRTEDGTWRITHPRIAQAYRMNAGTIVEALSLDVRLVKKRTKSTIQRGGFILGKIEEAFLETLGPKDTFLFGGEVLRFEGIFETSCLVTRAPGTEPKVPYWGGSKFPLTTFLAGEVRAMLADPARWSQLPEQVGQWLALQAQKSVIPGPQDLLVETFPRGPHFFMVLYPFEGRIAHQTLGMLLTRRLERARAKPLGFVATDYAISIWGKADMGAMIRDGRIALDDLFDEDMLGDDLEAWMGDSWLLKRTFRQCAVIAQLVQRNQPGQEKTGRQVTVSTDLVYDVLRAHEPDHILLKATWADAASGLLDVARVSDLLARIKHHIVHKPLDKISPLAVPVMLEAGRERVEGEARDEVFEEAMVREALG